MYNMTKSDKFVLFFLKKKEGKKVKLSEKVMISWKFIFFCDMLLTNRFHQSITRYKL